MTARPTAAAAVSVAPAGPEDAPLLSAMMLDLFSRGAWSDRRTQADAEALLRALLGVGHAAHLFRRAGNVVGYALTRDGGDYVFIRHFLIRLVRLAHRGQGTGRAALAKLTRSLGSRPLRLNVMPGNEAAMGFWRAMGFAPAATSMSRPAP